MRRYKTHKGSQEIVLIRSAQAEHALSGINDMSLQNVETSYLPSMKVLARYTTLEESMDNIKLDILNIADHLSYLPNNLGVTQDSGLFLRVRP